MGETKTLMTAEQLWEIGGDQRVELVRGEVLEMAPVGIEHAQIVGRLTSWLVTFVEQKHLGIAGTELGVVLARDPDVVRAPDISFISATRLPAADRERFFEGAPDLAVEVVSPADKAGEMQQKIREYLAAGARLVWLADPRSRTLTAYHPSGDAHVYAGDEEVTGEEVIAGFSFRPSDLFRLE